MGDLKISLKAIEAFGLSLSIISPTLGAAFDVSLTAGAGGRTSPLIFAVGAIIMMLLGYSFVYFTRRNSKTGSSYVYIKDVFGPSWGFLAGWAMFLGYYCYVSAVAGLSGAFVDEAISSVGYKNPHIWAIVAILEVIVVTYINYRDVKISTRALLIFELVSMLVIFILGIIVFVKTIPEGIQWKVFYPSSNIGVSGVAAGLVFSVLAFSGFEGAATLAEETSNPRKNIPIAMFGALLFAGFFYVFIAYCETVGFGINNTTSLANSASALGFLSSKFIPATYSGIYTFFISVAVAVSSFACAMGSSGAASRMLLALGRGGLHKTMAHIHEKHGTPIWAIFLVGLFSIIMLIIGSMTNVTGGNYFAYVATVGVMSIMLAYFGVGLAAFKSHIDNSKYLTSVIAISGGLAILYPLYGNIFPVPPYPYNYFPYIVGFWMIAGVVTLKINPSLKNVTLPEKQAFYKEPM